MSDLVTLVKEFAQFQIVPTFIVDPDGSLLYYNPPAEKILGRSFAETGCMPASVWSRLFEPTDAVGMPLLPENLTLTIALTERRPAVGELWIMGLDDIRHHIQVSSFPLFDGTGKLRGAVAMFWDI